MKLVVLTLYISKGYSHVAQPSRHILLIDDDITSLDIVSFLFEEKGYVVDRCADGASAIEYVRHTLPNLVLVDLMMPGIDGKETIRQIRAMGHQALPIVAFTAVDDPEIHAETLKLGCNEVLTKPLRPDKLLQKVEKFLK